MYTINLLYTSEQEFDRHIQEEGIDRNCHCLIRVHTCIHTADNIMPLVELLKDRFPNSRIIGSSTTGVLYRGEICTDRCLISITPLSNSTVRTFLFDISNREGNDVRGSVIADRVINNAVTENSKFMLAFFARSYLKISSFVERFNEKSGGVQLIGGVANTSKGMKISIDKESFVFDSERVSNDSLAVAVIDSEVLKVNSDLIYVTEPVGVSHTITDADGMIIRAIDGVNAVEWYQNQLGIDLKDESEYDITVLFPLVRSDKDDMPWALSYSPQNEKVRVFPDEPEAVMFVPNEAKAGEKVRISYSSVQKTIDVCESVCEDINSNPAEVLFGYSCISRQTLFRNCSEWELAPFRITNLSGALVSGEIGNIGDKNRYCNYSFAIAALAESNRKVRVDTELLRQNAGSLVNDQEHIIKYLVNSNKAAGSNEELQRRQHEIEESIFKDTASGISNITKYSFDFSMGKFDKICMISFRNEGLLNAFMSKSKFNMYLGRLYRSIIEFINDDNFGCYVYRKSALIVTCSPTVCDGEFVDIMRSLQNFISDYHFAEYLIVTEFSMVMHEDDMLNKAELTLLSMREKKNFFLIYTSDLGLVQTEAKKMKMLKILSDAVANDRVIPYFQGIRDNAEGRIRIYESLMRVRDEEGNIYNPGQFLNIAREYGFYPEMSLIMVNKVMNRFRDEDICVTLNLNISDIYNYKIVHFILQFLENAPHPENYIFELTETEEIEDYQIIGEFVEQIHQMGGKIAIDDFGSGFSNIVNIFKIKSDFIKIDGEIVKNIRRDVYALEFLEMIADWAVKHKKEIIAEFIENQDVQDIINANGIRYSQGYLFSKPSKELLPDE